MKNNSSSGNASKSVASNGNSKALAQQLALVALGSGIQPATTGTSNAFNQLQMASVVGLVVTPLMFESVYPPGRYRNHDQTDPKSPLYPLV